MRRVLSLLLGLLLLAPAAHAARGFDTTFGTGSTDRVSVPVSSDAGPVTYCMWTYRNGDGAGGLGRIIDDGGRRSMVNQSGGNQYNFGYSWTTGAEWRITRPATGAWVHYCVAYDPSAAGNVPAMYLNGAAQSVSVTTAATGSPLTSNTPVTIGNNGAATRNWDGMLAVFARWNRVLTAGEILAQARGQTPDGNPQGLQVYVPMVRAANTWTGADTTITGTVVQPHPPKISWAPPVWVGQGLIGPPVVGVFYRMMMGVGQ